MSTFIKNFIERETISRRHFLLASAAGLGAAVLPNPFGGGARAALTDPAIAWSYRDRASAIGTRSSPAAKHSSNRSASRRARS